MSANRPARTLSLRKRISIRWRHRRVANPAVWRTRVRFDELINSNEWDLAANMDDLNDRYEGYRLNPWERQNQATKPPQTDSVDSAAANEKRSQDRPGPS